MTTKGEVLVSRIADAVAANSAGKIEVIVDWKSDVLMNANKLNAYRGQLDAYRKTAGAARCCVSRAILGLTQSQMKFRPFCLPVPHGRTSTPRTSY
jgi:hypothetical protein